jgi:DNA-binding NarL/FixJ family response regulator
LIVEDQELVAMTLTTVVRRLNFELVGSAPTAERAIELARDCQPDVVLMDFHLKGVRDGAETAGAILHETRTRIVFLTGSSDPADVARMRAVGPDAIVFKPFRRTELADALAQAARAAAVGRDSPAGRLPGLAIPAPRHTRLLPLGLERQSTEA